MWGTGRSTLAKCETLEVFYTLANVSKQSDTGVVEDGPGVPPVRCTVENYIFEIQV